MRTLLLEVESVPAVMVQVAEKLGAWDVTNIDIYCTRAA